MSSVFGGDAKKEARRQARKQEEDNRLALARSQQDAQAREQDTQLSMSALSKAPRGRRLLIGDTAGSATLGGGA